MYVYILHHILLNKAFFALYFGDNHTGTYVPIQFFLQFIHIKQVHSLKCILISIVRSQRYTHNVLFFIIVPIPKTAYSIFSVLLFSSVIVCDSYYENNIRLPPCENFLNCSFLPIFDSTFSIRNLHFNIQQDQKGKNQ